MRRKLLIVVTVALVLLYGVSPMWGQTGSSGQLTVVMGSFSTETLDPILGGLGVKFYLSQIFDYLVGVTPDGRLSGEGGVAYKWEYSRDFKRLTFFLRKGIKFHNGDALTAEDVKFSIQRSMSPRSTTGYAGPLRTLIQDIEIPAEDRVVLVLKKPSLIIPTYLSRALSSEGIIVSKKYLESVGDDRFGQAPIGSGPYRFVERVTGSYLTLEAVKSHWRIGTPKYKTLKYLLVPEESTRVALLRNGEADIIEVGRERVKELTSDGFPITMRKEDAHMLVWPLQKLDGTPYADKRVREALNLAINRKELASSLFVGMAEPAAISFGFSISFPDLNFKVTPDMSYAYDPVRAKKLLAEAGYPNGFPIKIYSYQLPGISEGKVMAEALAGYWQNIGLQPKLVPVDYGAFRKNWVNQSDPGAIGYFNLANREWAGTYGCIEKMATSKSKATIAMDPEIDKLVLQILNETDQEKIGSIMGTIFKRLRSEHHGIPLLNLHTPYAMSKKIKKWDAGVVMYDLNIDELVRGK